MERSVVKLRRRRTTRIGIILALLVIAAMVLTLLPIMERMGAKRAREGKHSFDQYVFTHHLGKLTVVDTGTGIDPVSDVLTLTNNVPDAKRQAFVMDLMKHYVEYDQGQTLSVMYFDHSLNKNVPVGFGEYDMHTHKVRLDITMATGRTVVTSKLVDWS